MGNAIGWNGHLPLRRYAIFRDIFHRKYTIVIKGRDVDVAEKWGGFVPWLGKSKPAEERDCRTR